MRPSWDSSDGGSFPARFEDGPRRGTVAFVLALDTGQPPDLLLVPGRPDGVYLLAGGERGDGSLPYWWMTRKRLAAIRAMGRPHRIDGTTNTS
jgi:hypothetical protein